MTTTNTTNSSPKMAAHSRTGRINDSYVWKVIRFDNPRFMKTDITGTKIHWCLFFDVFKAFHQVLKFRYEFVKPFPKLFGKLEKNGSWSGAIGQLNRKEADILPIPTFLNYKYSTAVEYSSFILSEPVQFIIMKGGKQSNWDSVTKPFSFWLWTVIFISIIVCGIIYYYLIKSDLEYSDFSSISKVCWCLFSLLVNQGCNLNGFNGFACRLSIGIWLISVTILVASYSGNLMSFMTNPVYESVPTTFDELAAAVENKEYECGTVVGGEIYVLGGKSGSAKILGDHITSNNHFFSENEIVERLLNSKFALIRSRTLLDAVIKKFSLKNVLFSEDSMINFYSSFVVRKGFPHKRNLDELGTRLFESGIINKLTNRGIIYEKRGSEYRPINLQQLISPFVLYLFGHGLAIVCFIVEMIVGNLRNQVSI